LADKDNGMFIDAIAPYEIAKVEKGTPAEKAGLKEKDIIMQVNGKPTQYFHELQSALKENTNKSVVLTVRRNNQDLTISSKVDSAGHLGFNPKFLLNFSTKKYSLWQSIPRGTFLSFDVVADQVKAISKIFRRELSASNSFGSFLSIGKAYGGQWIWERFWRLTGMLSMILAFMNLLPIPALDGGHVMFLSYEMITRRKPSDKFLEGAQKVGMVILLTLMVFAIGNDVYRNIFK
jgi:regulator of sigma E protease